VHPLFVQLEPEHPAAVLVVIVGFFHHEIAHAVDDGLAPIVRNVLGDMRVTADDGRWRSVRFPSPSA
jgi:hypothetical protein